MVRPLVHTGRHRSPFELPTIDLAITRDSVGDRHTDLDVVRHDSLLTLDERFELAERALLSSQPFGQAFTMGCQLSVYELAIVGSNDHANLVEWRVDRT